jgi:hypothetical protein
MEGFTAEATEHAEIFSTSHEAAKPTMAFFPLRLCAFA